MTPSTAMATSTPAVSEQTATLKRNSEVTEATPSSSASHGINVYRVEEVINPNESSEYLFNRETEPNPTDRKTSENDSPVLLL